MTRNDALVSKNDQLQERARVLMAGDYVEVIAHHGSDEDEDYSGWRGHVLGEPVPTTPENPIAILLEGDADFGPVLFRAEELQIVSPGRASRDYADALAELERVRGALEWYADACNWDQGIDREGFPQDSEAQKEEGQRARAALALAPDASGVSQAAK